MLPVHGNVQKMDTDQDGVITLDEFLEACHKVIVEYFIDERTNRVYSSLIRKHNSM